jgi:PAS domain S-box-containing protein
MEKIDLSGFIDIAAIVTKADAKGKITYVNKRFEEVSGYKASEVIGRDHNIVNSGHHPKQFWIDMYRTVVKEKKVWNAICVNKRKDGTFYYVDSYIKAEFDDNGKLSGYMSIRQDITSVYEANKEITKQNEEIEKINSELKESLNNSENLRLEAEKAKEIALNDLDIVVKKSQTELMGSVVKTALYVILGIGIVTTGLYVFSIIIDKETQIIGSTWSNMFGILLTNAFSIVGTIMGVKYATEKNN